MRKKSISSKVSSRAIGWTLLLGAILGGRAYDKSKEKDENQDADNPKTEQTSLTQSGPEKVKEPNPFDNSVSNVKINENTLHGFLSKNWNDIAIGLTELETYIKKPTILTNETRATRGAGVTWNYFFLNDSLVRAPGTTDEAILSYDENYMQLAYHLEYETLSFMRNVITNETKLTNRQKIALVWAGYQRPADIKLIVAKLKKAKTQQQIADAFMEGKIPKSSYNGTMKRRWFCGAYAAGLIDINDILDMRRDAFSAHEIVVVKKGKHFKLDAKTVQTVLSGYTNKSTVREFLSQFEFGQKMVAGEQVVFPGLKINRKYEKQFETKKSRVKKTDKKKADKKKVDAKKADKKKTTKTTEQKTKKKTEKKSDKKAVKKAPKKNKSSGASASKKKQTSSAKKKTNKKVAFVDATKKLRNNAYSADLIKMKLARGDSKMV